MTFIKIVVLLIACESNVSLTPFSCLLFKSTEALACGPLGRRAARRVVLVPSQESEAVIIQFLTITDKTVVVTTLKRLAVKLHLVLVRKISL